MAETSDPQPKADNNLELLYSVPVELSVQLGSCMMPMKNVLELTPGTVVQLDKKADQPADLYVNDKLIAQGEIVVLDNTFGIKTGFDHLHVIYRFAHFLNQIFLFALPDTMLACACAAHSDGTLRQSDEEG